MTLEWDTVSDYPSGLNAITRVLTNRRGRQKIENQRDYSVRKIWPDVAGFESGGVGP